VAESVDALVNHPEVDLVIVLTTAPQHWDTVCAAIRAGKAVYCEWPLTTDATRAAELLHLAEAKGVRHVIGLQRRVAPHNQYLRDLLAAGHIGSLRSVRIHVSMNYFQARRGQALRWTAPPENFSSVIAIYAGHFLDMLFTATGWPTEISALSMNQFPLVTIAETGEQLRTNVPDQLVMIGRMADNTALSVQVEGGKRNGSGVQIDLTGHEGDLRITNTSPFGGVGDNYVVTGSQGDNVPLNVMPVPEAYDHFRASQLPSAVLELAELYAAFGEDLATGSTTAPHFADGLRMHRLLEAAALSSKTGQRTPVA
jgi:predicted dehydrogenase